MSGGVVQSVGEIGNYYGGLSVCCYDNKYYWSIENWNGNAWEEIPEYLYLTLIRYEKERGE